MTAIYRQMMAYLLFLALNAGPNAGSAASTSFETAPQPIPTPAQLSTQQPSQLVTEQSGSEFWPTIYGLRLKITDSLLVIFTCVLALFTALLWWSTNKLWKETRAASAISKQVADAAQLSAQITEKALVTNARALIFPSKIHAVAGFSQSANAIVDWTFFVIWENTGTTPARGMYMRTNWQSFDGQLPDDFAFPDIGNPKNVPIRIGPKSTAWSSECVVPIDVLLAGAEKRKHIYLWGWVEYNDVFDDRTRHRSEVGVEIVVVGDPKVARILEGVQEYPNVPFLYRGGQRFGGIDEECLRKPITAYPTHSQS